MVTDGGTSAVDLSQAQSPQSTYQTMEILKPAPTTSCERSSAPTAVHSLGALTGALTVDFDSDEEDDMAWLAHVPSAAHAQHVDEAECAGGCARGAAGSGHGDEITFEDEAAAPAPAAAARTRTCTPPRNGGGSGEGGMGRHFTPPRNGGGSDEGGMGRHFSKEPSSPPTEPNSSPILISCSINIPPLIKEYERPAPVHGEASTSTEHSPRSEASSSPRSATSPTRTSAPPTFSLDSPSCTHSAPSTPRGRHEVDSELDSDKPAGKRVVFEENLSRFQASRPRGGAAPEWMSTAAGRQAFGRRRRGAVCTMQMIPDMTQFQSVNHKKLVRSNSFMNHRDSSARKEWAAQQAAFEAKLVARRSHSCRNLVSAIEDYAQYADKTPDAASLTPEPEAPAYADASPLPNGGPMHRRTAMLRKEGMHNGSRPRSISEVGRSASVDHWHTNREEQARHDDYMEGASATAARAKAKARPTELSVIIPERSSASLRTLKSQGYLMNQSADTANPRTSRWEQAGLWEQALPEMTTRRRRKLSETKRRKKQGGLRVGCVCGGSPKARKQASRAEKRVDEFQVE